MIIHNIQVHLRPVQCTAFYIFHPSSREETARGYANSTLFLSSTILFFIRQFSSTDQQANIFEQGEITCRLICWPIANTNTTSKSAFLGKYRSFRQHSTLLIQIYECNCFGRWILRERLRRCPSFTNFNLGRVLLSDVVWTRFRPRSVGKKFATVITTSNFQTYV